MPKHTILFLAANPVGTDRLALDKEARAIRVELESSGFRDSFALETRWAAEPLDLLRELRKLRPTVEPFSGHGDVARPVSLDRMLVPIAMWLTRRDLSTPSTNTVCSSRGSDGRPQFVSTAALEETFGAAGASVKLVVLNACYSEVQAAALEAHVDCVVGMRGSILDNAARNFAIGFYGALGRERVGGRRVPTWVFGDQPGGLPDGDKPRLRARDGSMRSWSSWLIWRAAISSTSIRS